MVYCVTGKGRERMSVAKYQVFLKTVECGSFTAAARELNFTQSGVSHAIGSLEEELGVSLLVRSHGGVTPTADGRELLPYLGRCAPCSTSWSSGPPTCERWKPVW